MSFRLAQSFAFEATLGKQLNRSGSQLAYRQSRTSYRVAVLVKGTMAGISNRLDTGLGVP